jgi:hypothetical protein
LTDRPPERSEDRPFVAVAARRLTGALRSGFVIEAADEEHVRVDAGTEAWTVEGAPVCRGWTLRRVSRGFALLDGVGDEIGRSSRMPGVRAGEGPSWILRRDGSLFRLAPRAGREFRYELSGWETTGPYLEVRPETNGWMMAPTAAGEAVRAIESLVILSAAEVLEAEAVDGPDGAFDGDP